MKCKIQEVADLENIGRMLVVSDIHGHVHHLKGVLKKAGYTGSDTLVVVGDLIDKGPESLETVRYIMKLREENPKIYVTMGNVDHLRLDRFFNGEPEEFLELLRWTKEVWKTGFFLEILDELGMEVDDLAEENMEEVRRQIKKDFSEELGFLWNLPTILSIGNYIFVHAGIPTENLEKLKNVDAVKCMKVDAFLHTDVSFEKNVVVGHWPVCLYRDDIDCMNPIFDYQKHMIAIDGGCGLKHGAQLNALIIPGPEADIRKVTYTAYDDYPLLIAPLSQDAKEKTTVIRYFDSEVEVLEDRGDVLYLRHISTGANLFVPKNFVYYAKEKAHCDDCNDAYLEIKEGDVLSVIADTSAGYIVKKEGVMGWYNISEGGMSMLLRKYRTSDCAEMAELFYQTVHTVNAKDYTEEQLDAWASGEVNLYEWDRAFLAHDTIICVKDDRIVGFGDIDETGYLDRLYVHKDYQGQGIASEICDELEKLVAVGTITTHASITAKPFFEKRAYQVIKEQQVIRKGISLTNYVMQKSRS